MTDHRTGGGPGPGWIVAGEALIDLGPQDDGRLVPYPGGSPFNVAIGSGRLGVPTGYLGALSRDGFGQLLRERLDGAGVELLVADAVQAPTTLAVVHLDDDGRASYGFYLEGTAAARLSMATVPPLPDGCGLHVSFGAIGPGYEPTGTTLRALVERERGRRLVSLDPNVRPSAVAGDPERHAASLDALVADCDLVKASEEDLAALGVVDEVARRWARSGPAVVVLTRGPHGARALVDDRVVEVEVAGRDLALVDTVGAGDAFTAGLLWSLHRAGVGDREALDAHVADDARLRATLEDATRVAAETCTRAGADPPWHAELHD